MTIRNQDLFKVVTFINIISVHRPCPNHPLNVWISIKNGFEKLPFLEALHYKLTDYKHQCHLDKWRRSTQFCREFLDLKKWNIKLGSLKKSKRNFKAFWKLLKLNPINYLWSENSKPVAPMIRATKRMHVTTTAKIMNCLRGATSTRITFTIAIRFFWISLHTLWSKWGNEH